MTLKPLVEIYFVLVKIRLFFSRNPFMEFPPVFSAANKDNDGKEKSTNKCRIILYQDQFVVLGIKNARVYKDSSDVFQLAIPLP